MSRAYITACVLVAAVSAGSLFYAFQIANRGPQLPAPQQVVEADAKLPHGHSEDVRCAVPIRPISLPVSIPGVASSEAAASSEEEERPTMGPSAGDKPLVIHGKIERDLDARKVVVTSKLYTIDRRYKSMQGPWSEDHFLLMEPPAKQSKPELLWITGARVQMVGEDGKTPMPPQLMCHANIDIDSVRWAREMGSNLSLDGRLFTLSQGQLDVTFPEGFGIPILSHVPISLGTQVLNLNSDEFPIKVRHRVTIDVVRDRDLEKAMIPLFESGVSGMVSLEGKELVFDQAAEPTSRDKRAGCPGCCIPGKKAVEWEQDQDRHGRKFSGHWIVPPGRQVNKTRVTTMLQVPFETTVHYIAVHLHPYAETLELRDMTTGERVFLSKAKNLKDKTKMGLDHVDFYSNGGKGIKVYPNHEYELISVYNNPSDKDADSMAVMYVYMRDMRFKKP